MDKVARTFDAWAKRGRASRMEKEHRHSVTKFLGGIVWKKSFSFLDVGCGNGWVVREMIQNKRCADATGIDKSRQMIMQAEGMRIAREKYIHGDVETLKIRKKFDYIFAMESLYYANSMEASLGKIFSMLRTGGEFFCGTDFYADNKATAGWPKMMDLHMHLYSKKEWVRIFKDAGFQVRTRQVKDMHDKRRWRREYGTLFIIGKRPQRKYSNPTTR